MNHIVLGGLYMATRFSYYKTACIKGTAEERAIVKFALNTISKSYCRAETALQCLEGIAARFERCRIVIKCVGDYTCVFDSSAQTNEPDEWADELIAEAEKCGLSYTASRKKMLANKARELRRLGMSWDDARIVAKHLLGYKTSDRVFNIISREEDRDMWGDKYMYYTYNGCIIG